MAQLKSTSVTGNLSVTGNTVASKIIKINGTNDNILLADGSVTNLSTINNNIDTARTTAQTAINKFSEYYNKDEADALLNAKVDQSTLESDYSTTK
jgi:hypothetical protein